MAIEVIFCADGNKKFADIAIAAGMTYGSQPLKTFYRPIDFADIDPNNVPPKDLYIEAIKRNRPKIATVMDWIRRDDLPIVLEWAEEIAPFSSVLVVIPKVKGGVSLLRKKIGIKGKIGGSAVRLGFSYPSPHGRADWDILYEMIGWPWGIHILGGPPQAAYWLSRGQFKMPRRGPRPPDMLTSALQICSADSNAILALAERCLVWQFKGRDVTHVSLRKLNGGERWGNGSNKAGAPYEAFRRSCENIMAMWQDKG